MRMAEISREVEVEASSRTAKYTYSELYEYVHVYCVCHLPESYDSNMIECDKCGSWFHFKCMGLRKNALPDTWFCTNCK